VTRCACRRAPAGSSSSSSSSSSSQHVLGLLRWPQPNQHKAMPLPLVSMARDGRCLTLLARSVDEYLHRCARAAVCGALLH
jgi:hypothetical protein